MGTCGNDAVRFLRFLFGQSAALPATDCPTGHLSICCPPLMADSRRSDTRLCRAYIANSAVPMLVIVPVREVSRPDARCGQIGKARERELWCNWPCGTGFAQRRCRHFRAVANTMA